MSTTSSLQTLFQDAEHDGMSAVAAGILVNNLNLTTIAGTQGASVDDLAGDEVTLFVEVIDKTGSMSPYQHDVIIAYNEQLKALAGSKAADAILMSTWLFNTTSTLLHGYLLLPNVPPLDSGVYLPGGSTALHDAILDALTGVVAYGQSLRNAGIRTKIVVVVISDGEDNSSKPVNTATRVRTVVEDLLLQEFYIFAFVAFGANGKQIAANLGFPAKNVMDESTDSSGIRRALGTVSKSVIRASQTTIGGKASQGFFTP